VAMCEEREVEKREGAKDLWGRKGDKWVREGLARDGSEEWME